MSDAFYLSYDNPIVWQLTSTLKGAVSIPDHTAITRFVLELELGDTANTKILIDTDNEATFITTTITDMTLAPLKLSAAKKAELINANYTARLVVYSVDYPNGIAWFDGRAIKVLA